MAFQIDCSQEFRIDLVQSFYQTFFNRQADSAGRSKWVDQLNAGVTDESVTSSLPASQEYAEQTGT